MDRLRLYVVFNDKDIEIGVGFSAGFAWQAATEMCNSPVLSVIKYQESGWYCKEYTILK